MISRNHPSVLSTICAALVLGSALATAAWAADPPGREFSATAVVDSSQGTRRMPLSLIANRFTSVDEAKQLASVLEHGGQTALLSSLQGRSDGQIGLGAMRLPVALVVVEETSRGFRYLFLTPRRIKVEEQEFGKESLDYPFGIAVFEVDGFNGRGSGSLHVAAALAIDADGHIGVVDYNGIDGRFEDLRKIR